MARQPNQRSGLLGDLGLVDFAGDGDAASAAELEEALVPQTTQGTKHGVGVDAHHRGQVAGGWEPVPGPGLALRDRTPDRRGGLVVQRDGACLVQLEISDGAGYGSFID